MGRQETLQFVDALVGAKAGAEALERQTAARDQVVDALRADLDDTTKAELRAGFTFQVKGRGRNGEEKSSFDARGSEHEVDTFGASREGLLIRKDQYKQVHDAMTRLLAITRKALDARDAAGQPVLRTRQDVMDEVFTPLVREGVLPENFVPDDYSEVKRLLTETFKGYRDRLREEQEDKALAREKATMDSHGAGSALDRITGTVAVLKNLGGDLLDEVMSEDNRRVAGIVVAGGKAAVSVAQAASTVQRMADGRLEAQMGKFLGAEQGNLSAEDKGRLVYGDAKYDELDRIQDPKQVPAQDLAAWNLIHGKETWTDDPDLLRTAMAQAKRAGRLRGALTGAETAFGLSPGALAGLGDKLVKLADEQLDSDWKFYTESSLDLAKELASSGIAVGKGGLDVKKLGDFLGRSQHEAAARRTAVAAIGKIDAALAAVVARKNAALGAAIDGLYEARIDKTKLQEATAPDPDGAAIVKVLAAGFAPAFAAACPRAAPKKEFEAVGADVASRFVKAAPAKGLEEAIRKDPGGDAFGALVAIVARCAEPALTPAFLQQVERHQGAIVANSVFPDEDELVAELDESDEQMRAYEDSLVLIDEGGVAAAEQRSIEALIREIKKDRKVLDLVQKIGGGLESLTGTSLGIAGWATAEVTDKLVGQVMGPLKAAKLIMELAINVKKAADRHILFSKFQRDLGRSRKAVSSLSSTIQGFLDNKAEQIAFRDLEIALQTIELAATIVGSVPEPFTMAIGKTINAVNSAAQATAKVTEMIYDEVKLRQAWKTTKLAMQNPKDRALGLKALKLNPTLGMHAIAWAGIEQQPPDPIARMVMGSVGLDENTLAVSGTERKVREYLETLLDEDRKLTDAAKVQADWMPGSFALTSASWYAVTSRACREAVPALRRGGDGAVLAALKKVEAQPLKALQAAAERGSADRDVVEACIDQATTLKAALAGYAPKASDGSDHDEMSGVVDRFAALATEHLAALRALATRNLRGQEAALRDLEDFLVALRALGHPKAATKLTRAQFDAGVASIESGVMAFGGEPWTANVVVQDRVATCRRDIAALRAAAPTRTFQPA